eukprot:scaffold21592_cov125-Isochrysis_galbana.AAC.4
MDTNSILLKIQTNHYKLRIWWSAIAGLHHKGGGSMRNVHMHRECPKSHPSHLPDPQGHHAKGRNSRHLEAPGLPSPKVPNRSAMQARALRRLHVIHQVDVPGGERGQLHRLAPPPPPSRTGISPRGPVGAPPGAPMRKLAGAGLPHERRGALRVVCGKRLRHQGWECVDGRHRVREPIVDGGHVVGAVPQPGRPVAQPAQQC